MQRALLLVILGTAVSAWGDSQFKAGLTGYDEVPSLSTTGSGQATAAIANDGKSIVVTLSFTKLQGVAQSAILGFGSPGTVGGILAYICGGPKPSCPGTAAGTVTATLVAADVQAVAGQGIAAGDLAALILAIQNGAVYVNVRTTTFANGEIRGQLGRGNGPPPGKGRNKDKNDKDDDDDD